MLPGGTNPLGTASVIVHGTIDGTGPYLLAHKRRIESLGRRSAQALSLHNVTVTGELFPSDAGKEPIINKVTIPVPPTTYSASVPFSNVTPHSNQWVVLTFTGNATDGSQIALGELAGLINVAASTTNSATLTKTTTQTFQVFSTLLAQGDLSTNDIDTLPTLATTLTTDITATHIAVDPATQLFTSGGLVSILNLLEPKFERDLTFSSSPVLPGSLTLTRDWTNASEVNLANNLTDLNLLGFLVSIQRVPTVAAAWGSNSNCGLVSTNPPNIPPTQSIVAVEDAACVFANPAGSTTLRNVYGGHLIVGVTNNVNGAGTAFNGGHLSVAGETAGAHSFAVTDAASSLAFTVNDPAGFAFGPAFWSGGGVGLPQAGGFFMTQPNYGSALQSDTLFSLADIAQTQFASRVVPKTAPYSATPPHNIILVDTFNAWNVPNADMELCGGISCFPLTSTGTLTISRPFADAGTDLAFFNWKVGGKATHIAAGSGMYNITFSGPGTATLTSTTPTALMPDQGLNLSFGFTMPNDKISVNASDAANTNVYTGFTTLSFGSASMTMNNAQTVKIKQVVITIAYTGGAGVQQLTSIQAPGF
jgi:hypothetical protein